MRYEITTNGDEIVLALGERFTAVDAMTFRRVAESLQGESVRSVIIDMKDVDYIDSAAMGLLVLVRDNLIQHRIDMKVRSPRGQVKKAFDIFNFDQLFTIEA